MPKYYLLGGENIHKRDAKEVNQRAFNDAGGTPRVIVFSWARASFDNSYVKNKIIFDYFRNLGASTVINVNYSSTNGEIKEKMSESDLVYLTGGVPSVLVERLRKLAIGNLFENFEGVIIGRSAGALALCSKCIVTCRSNRAARVINGLGLVDLTLKAHYKLGLDEKLKELSENQDVFAVPKGSAVVCDNGNMSFINTVYLFHKGEKKLG